MVLFHFPNILFYLLFYYPKKKIDDNLFIEYLNGLCINELATYFPNVVRTIGLFEIDDEYHLEYLQNNINLKHIKKINIDKKTLYERPDNIIKYLNCSDKSKHYFFGIEYINNAIRFGDWIDNVIKGIIDSNDINKYDYDIFTIIYQLYLFIDTVSDKFVHNDLHVNNIMIYEVKDRIQMNYFGGSPVNLYVKYIPIIIDYGRAYCKETYEHNIFSLINKYNHYNCGINSKYNNIEQSKLFCFFNIMFELKIIEKNINELFYKMHYQKQNNSFDKYYTDDNDPNYYTKYNNLYKKYKDNFLKNKLPYEYSYEHSKKHYEDIYSFVKMNESDNGFLKTFYTNFKKSINYNKTNFLKTVFQIIDNFNKTDFFYEFDENDTIRTTNGLMSKLYQYYLDNNISVDTTNSINIDLRMIMPLSYIR